MMDVILILLAFMIIFFVALWWRMVKINRKINSTLSTVSNKLGSIDMANERRVSLRVSDYIVAKVSQGDPDEFMQVLNISYEGARLHTVHNFRAGDIIDLSLFFPLDNQNIYVKASVVDIVPDPQKNDTSPRYGVGIKFLDVGALEKKVLIKTVDLIKKLGLQTLS